MKFIIENSPIRKINTSLSIIDLFNEKDFAFDCVVASLDGNHPKVINHESDRIYFILEGFGTAMVSSDTFKVKKFDLVAIKKGCAHSLKGKLKYLIITSPPFESANEEFV